MTDKQKAMKFAWAVRDAGQDIVNALAEDDNWEQALDYAEAAVGDAEEVVKILESRLEEPSP